MSVMPQASIVGWGIQPSKGVAPTTFYKHPALNADLSEIDDVRVSPPEINGVPVPSAPYSVGPAAQGGIRINPRLAGVIGWLLKAIAGNVTTTADTPEVGANTHVFAIDSTTNIPYVTVRELVKGNTAADDFGRDIKDAKVVQARFALSNDGLLPVDFGFLGRDYQHYSAADVASWTWGNTDEPDSSIPYSSVNAGYLQVPGLATGDLPIAGGTVTFVNNPNDIRRERVYGSPYMDEVTIVSKGINLELALLYKNADMYRAIMDGSATGTGWTPAPFTSDVDIMLQSTANIGATSTPYSLRIQIPNVMFTVRRGLQLAGDQSIILNVVGTAVKPASGNFATITLVNDYTAYP